MAHSSLTIATFFIIATRLKDNILHSKYAFAPQCTGNISICSQMGFLVSKMFTLTLNHSNHSNHLNKISFTLNILSKIFYTARKILRQSNHSNKIFFTSNVPYTLKYLKIDLLHLKRGLKTLKSLK